MIESLLYFGIGFLFAGLFVWAVVPYVRARGRLTARRLQAVPFDLDQSSQRIDFSSKPASVRFANLATSLRSNGLRRS
jgi:hypothetical protein